MPADTVDWVRQQAARLPRVPSLAFVHIPLPQHMLAWERGAVNGTKGEMVGCPGVDTGFFELARWAGRQACTKPGPKQGRSGQTQQRTARQRAASPPACRAQHGWPWCFNRHQRAAAHLSSSGACRELGITAIYSG